MTALRYGCKKTFYGIHPKKGGNLSQWRDSSKRFLQTSLLFNGSVARFCTTASNTQVVLQRFSSTLPGIAQRRGDKLQSRSRRPSQAAWPPPEWQGTGKRLFIHPWSDLYHIAEATLAHLQRSSLGTISALWNSFHHHNFFWKLWIIAKTIGTSSLCTVIAFRRDTFMKNRYIYELVFIN